MGKVFVHTPLKRAELKRLTEPKPEPVEQEPIEHKQEGSPTKELQTILRSGIRLIEKQDNEARQRKLQEVIKHIKIHRKSIKEILRVIEDITDKEGEEIAHVIDPIDDMMIEYMYEIIHHGWEPKCLTCETTFSAAHNQHRPRSIVTYDYTTGEERQFIASGAVCTACGKKNDKVLSLRFINSILHKHERAGIRVVGKVMNDPEKDTWFFGGAHGRKNKRRKEEAK